MADARGVRLGALRYLQTEIRCALDVPRDNESAARTEGRREGLIEAAELCENDARIFKGHADNPGLSAGQRAYFFNTALRMASAGAAIRAIGEAKEGEGP